MENPLIIILFGLKGVKLGQIVTLNFFIKKEGL